MKREHEEQLVGDGSGSPVRKLPRVAAVSTVAEDGAAFPVSPTVAAGILPRAPRTPSSAPPHILPSQSQSPVSPLAAARDRLARASDAHVQARLLQQLSAAAAAPGARTNAAIDFLFAFLQQSQGDGADSARAGGGPVVVGAIVRGLRELLRVKAAVVEPMIQVDAMGEQLMQCVSVAEDFKLRQDMLQIVVDCLVLTRAFAHVERLLGACVRDHDAAMQAICVRGYVRLLDAGHQLATDPLQLFDLVASLLLHGGDDEQVKLWAVRLLTALSNAHPRVDSASRFFPGVGTSADSDSESGVSPTTLCDKAFFVLCMTASGAPPSVRKEIALALREFGETSLRVVEHALQKSQISEEIEDYTDLKTVLMLSSGALLDLLEDRSAEISTEASKSMMYLAKVAKWSEPILDRAIAAHVDLLPGSSSKAATCFLAFAETLEQLLVLRKEQYGAEFSLTSEEMNYIVRDKTVQFEPSSMLAILRILIRCDASTAWMVKRTVEYALHLADSMDKTLATPAAATGDDQCARHLPMLGKEIQRKCGAAIHQDVALMDSLRAARLDVYLASGTKARLASILLGESAQVAASECNGGGAHSGSSRSVSALFKFASARPQSTENEVSTNSRLVSEYERLVEVPSEEQLATGLKAEIVDLACALYIKESQLSWSPRADLLQLVLLARVGLTIDHIQRHENEDESAMVQWLSGEAAKLEFLRTQSAAAPWLDIDGLRSASSLSELSREFASALQKAWPSALVQALSTFQVVSSRAANAVVLEPNSNCKEPREIIAQWPFTVRVKSLIGHAGDISRIFIKSVLPNGEAAYARVPMDRIRVKSSTQCIVEHDIKLTVSPFSDPTSFSVAICIEHPVLPGAVVNVKDSKGDVKTPTVTYTEISESVSVRIFHRTNSTVRRG